jgi:hypothetical protein
VHYLSPEIRTDPWTEAEDRILVQQINQHGFAWSAISHCFNGRSDNDIKNRWYSHLKYETRQEGERLVFAAPSECLYPERKKRNRAKVYPKQNALRFLQRNRESVLRPLPLPVLVPHPAPSPAEDPPPCPFETEDFLDRMIADECAESQFLEFQLF